MDLTAEEYEYLEMVATAFAAGQLFKADHPLTPILVRRGVIRTSGQYVTLTGFGVDLLRARGHQGRLPQTRADSTTLAQRGDKTRH